MQGHMYSYIWLRYGAIELLKMGANGPESIAFLQGEEASQLYDELDGCENDEQVDWLISQYDYVSAYEARRVSA
jgi:hypothetical protein